MTLGQKPQLGLLLFSLLILTNTVTVSADDKNITVYEILPRFGLPSGLLPDSVKSYTLSPDDGSFVVELQKPCYIQFDYLIYYDTKITGTIQMGSITDLKGIEVQRIFFWFDVDEIRVDFPPSDSIYFQVGFINKELDVGQFESVHSCRDNALSLCGGSWKRGLQLPTPMDEVQMFVTE